MSGGSGCPHVAEKRVLKDFRVGTGWLPLLNYAVFALGDSVYGERYCTVGLALDEQLKKLGATRILARGMGDAQYT